MEAYHGYDKETQGRDNESQDECPCNVLCLVIWRGELPSSASAAKLRGRATERALAITRAEQNVIPDEHTDCMHCAENNVDDHSTTTGKGHTQPKGRGVCGSIRTCTTSGTCPRDIWEALAGMAMGAPRRLVPLGGFFLALHGMAHLGRAAMVVDRAPAWSVLSPMLGALQDVQEKLERGPTSHQANIRLFDAPADCEPRVELFRDQAAWCPYCQKLWMQLEEKRIPYTVTKVPMSCYGQKPLFFRLISPSGAIPVARVDGRVVSESNDIMFLLEDVFGDQRPLWPKPGDPDYDRACSLLQLERALFGAWFTWLRSSSDSGRGRFEDAIARTEAELEKSGGPFFLGEDVSLVDIMFIPFVERMAASLPYYKGFVVRGSGRYPNLDRWFTALRERTDWYAGIESDYYTHVHALPPQVGGCGANPEGQRYREEIDGVDGRSWSLPLPDHDKSIEPIPPRASDEDARTEAAEAIVRNHATISRFAARAVGSPGSPRVGAPLSDPNARPAEDVIPAVDVALRHVVHALMKGTDAAQAQGLSELPADEVSLCLAYLRDRVGVPRDMSLPAARQLRAHLNWLCAELNSSPAQ